jgi:methylenetetrahydrofolate reductase (NADPH)
MSLKQYYGPGKFGLSFELFPPKTPAGEGSLFTHVEQLMAFQPSYVTCTYGAGGSTRSKTLAIVEQVRRRFQVPVASHLTCVGATTDQLRAYLAEARQREVGHIVALRGDPPHGDTEFRPVPGGLRYANELVAMIRAEFSEFGIAVAGYPETHREAPSPDVDLQNLKRKVESGADIVITQLFYDNRDYFGFRDRCEALGIRVPIVPGILPVTNLAQIQRITSMCGAVMPPDFIARLGERDDEDWQFQVGVEFATRQVAGLLSAGVPGIHFYVLNKSQATSAVLHAVRR